MESEIQTQIPGIDHVISEYSVVSLAKDEILLDSSGKTAFEWKGN